MAAKDDDDRYDFEDDENEESRSIFSATWFRIVLGTVGVAVIAAVALPYLLGGSVSAPEKSASTPPPLLDTKPAASLATPPPAPGASGPLVTVTPPPPGAPEPARSLPAAASAPPPAPDRAAVAEAPKSATEVARPAPGVQAKRPAPKPVAQVRPAAAKPSSVKGAPSARKAYWVQVGTFKDPAAARRLAAKLRDQKHAGASRPVTVAGSSDRLSRVRVGPFADRATASTTVRSLQTQGFKPFVVTWGA